MQHGPAPRGRDDLRLGRASPRGERVERRRRAGWRSLDDLEYRFRQQQVRDGVDRLGERRQLRLDRGSLLARRGQLAGAPRYPALQQREPIHDGERGDSIGGLAGRFGLAGDRRVEPAQRVDEPVQLDAGVSLVQATLEGPPEHRPERLFIPDGVEEGERATDPPRRQVHRVWLLRHTRTGEVGAAQHRSRSRMRHRWRGDEAGVVALGLGHGAVRQRDIDPVAGRVGPKILDPAVAAEPRAARGGPAQRGQPAGDERRDPGVDAVRACVERLGEEAVQLGGGQPGQGVQRSAEVGELPHRRLDVRRRARTAVIREELAQGQAAGHARDLHVEAVPGGTRLRRRGRRHRPRPRPR